MTYYFQNERITFMIFYGLYRTNKICSGMQDILHVIFLFFEAINSLTLHVSQCPLLIPIVDYYVFVNAIKEHDYDMTCLYIQRCLCGSIFMIYMICLRIQ